MGRRRRKARSWRKPRARAPMTTGWYRPGPINLGDFLTSGSASTAIIEVMNGGNLVQTRPVALDVSRSLDPKILRIIVRIVINAINAVAGIIELWYGWRIVEVGASGDVPNPVTVLVNTDEAREEDWLWRGQAIAVVPTTNQTTNFVDIGTSGQNGIFMDFQPNRKLRENEILIFTAAWRVAGGAGPTATCQGTLNFEALISVPK